MQDNHRRELDHFRTELCKLVAEPVISEIYHKFEQIRQKELSRAIRKMGESDEKKLGVLDRFSRELMERIVQIPVEQLRIASLNSNSDLLDAAETIFQVKTFVDDAALVGIY